MKLLTREEILRKTKFLLSSSRRQIFLAVLRCLRPDEETMQVRLDTARLRDEFLLMKYYGEPFNNRSLIAAGAPVIFVNRDRAVIVCELEHLFFQMRGREPESREKIALNLLIDLLTQTDPKASLISYNPPAGDKEELIAFQKAKVALMQEASEKNWSERMLERLYSSAALIESERSLLAGFSENGGKLPRETKREAVQSEEEPVIGYLFDIRNFRLRRPLYEGRADPMEVIRFREGESYTLPPLGKLRVCKKELKDQVLTVELQGKTQIYTFRFKHD